MSSGGKERMSIENDAKERVNDLITKIENWIEDNNLKRDPRYNLLLQKLKTREKYDLLIDLFKCPDHIKNRSTIADKSFGINRCIGDITDEKLSQKLENIVIINIDNSMSEDERTGDNLVNRIAKVFNALDNESFLDFKAIERWGDAFRLLAPDCEYNPKTTRIISYWKSSYKEGRNVNATDNHKCLLEKTAQTLGFDPDIWSRPVFLSDEELEDHIQDFIRKYLSKKKLDIDLASFKKLIPNRISKKEEDSLEWARSFIDKPKILSADLQGGNLAKLINEKPSEAFLYELLKLFYDNGYYYEAATYLFDKFHTSSLVCNMEFNLFKAHIFGSIGKYYKALQILGTLDVDDTVKYLDIKTSLISNALRHYLQEKHKYESSLLSSKTGINKEKLAKIDLEDYLKDYKKLFELENHYYPGVNYAYMTILSDVLDGKSKTSEDTIKEILGNSQNSIDDDKASEDPASVYYAVISEIELRALTGEAIDEKYFDELMKRVSPTIDMLSRTHRQIRFFTDVIDGIIQKNGQIPERVSKIKNSVDSLGTLLEKYIVLE